MAVRDLDIADDENSEVSTINLKEKLHLFSKIKLIGLFYRLINDFKELTCERGQLFKVFADHKFVYMELKDDKTITDKQNSCLKKHVEKLESSNLDLKFENLRMTITEKGKGKMSETDEKLKKELKKMQK